MLTECQIKGIIDYSICTNLKITCFLQQLQQQQPQPQLQPLQVVVVVVVVGAGFSQQSASSG